MVKTFLRFLVTFSLFSFSYVVSAAGDGVALHKLSEYKGKWVIVNYWASWCGPCRSEVPELNDFYKSHKGSDVVIVGVNYDKDAPMRLRQDVMTMSIGFPILGEDPATKLGIQEITGLPTSVLVSPEGKVVDTLVGEQTKYSLESALKSAKRKYA